VLLTKSPVLVVEDDHFLRMVGVVLDPSTPKERVEAYVDFFAHDERDFEAYCERVRTRAPELYPAQVRLVETSQQLRVALPGCQALIVKSLPVGMDEISLARDLRVVQKYGSRPGDISLQACASRDIEVLTLRHRANIARAEVAFMLMLSLAKKMHRLANRISVEQLAPLGYSYKPFDRRYTPNSNWARIPGLRMLNESTIGIIGLDEIDREIAIRAAAFGMRILYHQRTRLLEDEERGLQATYMPLAELLHESDWVVPQLPEGAAAKGMIDRTRFAQMKPGACLVNVSQAEVVDRRALIEALKSGRLGGFALDPLHEPPSGDNDELLKFDNVVMAPHIGAQAHFHALNDLADMIEGVSKAIAEQKQKQQKQQQK
jgi:phosphoglycerate dehydrogenase-like enzyme